MNRSDVLSTMGTKPVKALDKKEADGAKNSIAKEFNNPHTTTSFSSNGKYFEIFYYYTGFFK